MYKCQVDKGWTTLQGSGVNLASWPPPCKVSFTLWKRRQELQFPPSLPELIPGQSFSMKGIHRRFGKRKRNRVYYSREADAEQTCDHSGPVGVILPPSGKLVSSRNSAILGMHFQALFLKVRNTEALAKGSPCIRLHLCFCSHLIHGLSMPVQGWLMKNTDQGELAGPIFLLGYSVSFQW